MCVSPAFLEVPLIDCVCLSGQAKLTVTEELGHGWDWGLCPPSMGLGLVPTQVERGDWGVQSQGSSKRLLGDVQMSCAFTFLIAIKWSLRKVLSD